MWLVRVLDSVQQDVRDAVRGLRKSAGFSAVVIGTLALGIGANTSLFSIFNSLIMRPLAVRDPGSLALLTSGSWSYPVWEEIKAPAGRTRALRHRRARGERAPDGDWAAHGARRAGERYLYAWSSVVLASSSQRDWRSAWLAAGGRHGSSRPSSSRWSHVIRRRSRARPRCWLP